MRLARVDWVGLAISLSPFILILLYWITGLIGTYIFGIDMGGK